MPIGTIKWFNATKGYGMIAPADGGRDVFVHISAIERAGLDGLFEGMPIFFEVAMERGRSAAVNIQAAPPSGHPPAMRVRRGPTPATVAPPSTANQTQANSARPTPGKFKAPKVFISYEWESEDHKQWVRALATKLRSHGVELILDQWELGPGDELPRFMESSITTSKAVLIVCTPTYKAKSDRRAG